MIIWYKPAHHHPTSPPLLTSLEQNPGPGIRPFQNSSMIFVSTFVLSSSKQLCEYLRKPLSCLRSACCTLLARKTSSIDQPPLLGLASPSRKLTTQYLKRSGSIQRSCVTSGFGRRRYFRCSCSRRTCSLWKRQRKREMPSGLS